MKFTVKHGQLSEHSSDAVALFFFSGVKKPSGAAAGVDKALGGLIRDALASGDFEGGADEVAVISSANAPKRTFLVGLGNKEHFNAEAVRRAAGHLAKAAKKANRKTCAVDLDDLSKSLKDKVHAAQAFAEGASLGDYRFEGLKGKKSDDKRKAPNYVIVSEKAVPSAQRTADDAATTAECVKAMRDVNFLPGADATPEYLAQWARRVAKLEGATCRVLNRAAIEKEKMAGLLAVNQGSPVEPRFIVLEYKPAKKAAKTVALVGKGLTFDSGGISLKPGAKMHEMKYDKSGACSVIATVEAAARLKLPVHVVGLVASTDNMPDAKAQRPGDVIRYSNGLTVEVLNTDAEGRLVLADALIYAGRFKPDAIIDLATLTGAVLIALGQRACGALGNDQKLLDALLAAGERSGERGWQLPIWREYAEQLKSDCADLGNIGGRDAGTITAACFLEKFVPKGAKWAHLDIAGVSWTDSPASYQVKGPTGFGVRLLVEYLKSV